MPAAASLYGDNRACIVLYRECMGERAAPCMFGTACRLPPHAGGFPSLLQ